MYSLSLMEHGNRKSLPRKQELPSEQDTQITSALLHRRSPKAESKCHAQQHPTHGHLGLVIL